MLNMEPGTDLSPHFAPWGGGASLQRGGAVRFMCSEVWTASRRSGGPLASTYGVRAFEEGWVPYYRRLRAMALRGRACGELASAWELFLPMDTRGGGMSPATHSAPTSWGGPRWWRTVQVFATSANARIGLAMWERPFSHGLATKAMSAPQTAPSGQRVGRILSHGRISRALVGAMHLRRCCHRHERQWRGGPMPQSALCLDRKGPYERGVAGGLQATAAARPSTTVIAP